MSTRHGHLVFIVLFLTSDKSKPFTGILYRKAQQNCPRLLMRGNAVPRGSGTGILIVLCRIYLSAFEQTIARALLWTTVDKAIFVLVPVQFVSPGGCEVDILQ